MLYQTIFFLPTHPPTHPPPQTGPGLLSLPLRHREEAVGRRRLPTLRACFEGERRDDPSDGGLPKGKDRPPTHPSTNRLQQLIRTASISSYHSTTHLPTHPPTLPQGLQEDPYHCPLYQAFGMLLAELGRVDAARAVFEKVSPPTHPPTYLPIFSTVSHLITRLLLYPPTHPPTHPPSHPNNRARLLTLGAGTCTTYGTLGLCWKRKQAAST